MTAHTLPPGTYFIGDPGHVFEPETWAEIVEVIIKGGTEFRGHRFFAHSTHEGDGRFPSSNGLRFPVDSGNIGAIPKALWTKEPITVCFDKDPDGVVYDAPDGLTCWYAGAHFYFISNTDGADAGFFFNIFTGPDEDEEDDELGEPFADED